MNMSTANNSSLIVDQLITYADWFFPGEVDFDLEIGIINDTESQSIGMRRCVSNCSLSDHGESPTQGSPKPAARRKNKPAPTPPGGNTPDRHEKRDDKPPPTPDKPPRVLTSTLNRSTYKAQKHEVNTELVRHESNTEKHDKHAETDTKSQSISESIPTESIHFVDNPERLQETGVSQNEVFHDVEKSTQELQRYDTKVNIPSAKEKPNGNSSDNVAKIITEIEHSEIIVQKPKPVPTEKPSTLERRRPVAAPRSITNIVHNTGEIFFLMLFYIYINLYVLSFHICCDVNLYLIITEEVVELRKKSDSNVTNMHVSLNERSGKPAIPERPPGLVRPSSLIRQPRPTNDNLETDPGVSKKNLM